MRSARSKGWLAGGSSIASLVKRSATSSSRGGGRGRVVIAELGDVEGVADRQRERGERAIEEGAGQGGSRVAQLPEVPGPVDHAVVGPEDRVIRRGVDAFHRAAGPDVNAVVDALQLG